MEVGAGQLLCKRGAEGYCGMSLRPGALGRGSPAVGVAIKIADGHSEARFVAAFAVLRALGLVEPDDEALSRYAKIPQVNATGLATGELRAVFELNAH